MKVGTLRKANILCIFGGKDKHFTPPPYVKAMLKFNANIVKIFDSCLKNVQLVVGVCVSRL